MPDDAQYDDQQDDVHRLPEIPDVPEIPHVADLLDYEEVTAEGVEALRVPAELVEHEFKRKPLRRRLVEGVLSLGMVIAIFAFAIPAIAHSAYSDIFHALSQLRLAELGLLTALWFGTMVIYTGVLTNSLPGLDRTKALVLNFAGSAVSNVLPFGGAVGVAATYAMCLSWGFPVPAITLSILVSGAWNVLAKFALPAIALVVLVVIGEAASGLVLPTVIGLFLLLGAVVVFWLIIKSERFAVRAGEWAERFLSWFTRIARRGPVTGVKPAVLDFRHRSIGLIRERWRALSFWMLAYQMGHFLLLLLCVRLMGADTKQLGWPEVLAAFAFGNLLTAIPLTPSGVGFVEAGTVAILIAFGGAEAGSAAAVLLYRGFTYLAEIPLGAVAWLVWATAQRWRRPMAEAWTSG